MCQDACWNVSSSTYFKLFVTFMFTRFFNFFVARKNELKKMLLKANVSPLVHVSRGRRHSVVTRWFVDFTLFEASSLIILA